MDERMDWEAKMISTAKGVMPVPVSSEPGEQEVSEAPAPKLRVEGIATSAALPVSTAWRPEQASAVPPPEALESALVKLETESEPEAAAQAVLESAPGEEEKAVSLQAESAVGSAFSFQRPRLSRCPSSTTQEFRARTVAPLFFRRASEGRVSFPRLRPCARRASVPWEARYP